MFTASVDASRPEPFSTAQYPGPAAFSSLHIVFVGGATGARDHRQRQVFVVPEAGQNDAGKMQQNEKIQSFGQQLV